MKKLILTTLIISTPVFASMDHHDHHMEMPHNMPSSMPMDTDKPMNHNNTDENKHGHQHDKVMPDTHHNDALEMKHFMHHADLKGNPTESAQAYVHANHTMHEGMNIKFTGNADIDFLRGMIPHHQGAVEMAKIQLEYGTNGLLKSLTQQIIRDQELEIRFMKRRLAALEASMESQKKSPRSTMAYKRANHAMHGDMDITYSGNADIDFVAGMIPHHQGAVDMAEIVIKYGQDGNTRALAYEIISAQQSEISWMKRWQRRARLMRIMR